MQRPDLTKNGFELVETNGQQGIKCLDCGLTSYHPKDIEHKYCGNCHKFHESLFKGIDLAQDDDMTVVATGKKTGGKIMVLNEVTAKRFKAAGVWDGDYMVIDQKVKGKS